MPGPDDPANFALPQQVCLMSLHVMHKSYFICHISFVSDIHFSDSPCIDAFSLEHQLITHFDLVLILIPLSLKTLGNIRTYILQ